jgi:ATP-binding cassette subfamily F protein 3
VYEAPAPPGPDDFLLFRAEDLLLKRGERAGLVGPNGSGKTTFIRTLLGEIAPLEGRLRIGANVRIGYLAQAQDALQPHMTVLDALMEADPALTVGEARAYLARFLFTGDDVFKRVATLSGGQRSRLALARLSRQEVNFLVLDEPTNHLDIESQEVLEAMLRDFNGTVLLVSHDRYLIDAIATQVWVIDPAARRLFAYEGNYSAYLAEKEQRLSATPSRQEDKRAENQRRREQAREARRRRKEAERRQQEADALEARIHSMEQELATLSQALEEAAQARQLEEVQRLGERYHALERELEELIETWAALV